MSPKRPSRWFATVARMLAEDHGDLQSSLYAIVHLAVDNLNACEFAGITRGEAEDHLARLQQ